MKLHALSDLHVGHRLNREAIAALPSYGDDWLIVAGDVGETEAHLDVTLDVLCRRFAQVLWVPGNHELWTVRGPRPISEASGEPPRTPSTTPAARTATCASSSCAAAAACSPRKTRTPPGPARAAPT